MKVSFTIDSILDFSTTLNHSGSSTPSPLSFLLQRIKTFWYPLTSRLFSWYTDLKVHTIPQPSTYLWRGSPRTTRPRRFRTIRRQLSKILLFTDLVYFRKKFSTKLVVKGEIEGEMNNDRRIWRNQVHHYDVHLSKVLLVLYRLQENQKNRSPKRRKVVDLPILLFPFGTGVVFLILTYVLLILFSFSSFINKIILLP